MKSMPRIAKVGLLIFISAILMGSGYLFILWHPASYDVSTLVPSYEKIQEQDEVRLSVAKEAFSYQAKKIETQIINDTDEWLSYGYAFQLEVQIDGKWYKVPFRKGGYFLLPAIDAKPKSSSSFDHWIKMYQCRPGHHRIIKEVSIETDRDRSKIKESPELGNELKSGDEPKIEDAETTRETDAAESIRALTSQGLTGDQAAAVLRYRQEMEKRKKEPQRINVAVEFDLI
ncbi:hypothetical protein FRZ06_14375 [Anoxybacterium hadale]|uniref:Uncharacterized protein n=1 Tax=Anoxybacterium hadale TaxID=3408580 RepID=A0ACD1AE51_9FIRM|nr:hypothetical protein FRZ06_14375 [Clostridiales bacterium]